MFMTTLLAAVPPTPAWSPQIGFVMILCNVLAIALGKFTIKYQNAGPELPASNLFGGFGLPALLATTSFGHIIGAGAILGLTRLGVL